MRMSEVAIQYKHCTPEDIRCLERFEPEIQRAVVAKGLAGDVCWEAYASKGEVRDYRFFKLYVTTEPETFLGGDYGEAFLRRVSREEFFDWVADAHSSMD